MNELSKKIEAMIFSTGTPISFNKLISILECKKDELEMAIEELKEHRNGVSGLSVLTTDKEIMIATASELKEFISSFKKKEMDAPLSKAAQETLSIICYASPISKVDLDFLRGVNTNYTIRRLALKGLVKEETLQNKKVLTPTIDLLTHFSITKIEELQDYNEIREKIITGLEKIKNEMK